MNTISIDLGGSRVKLGVFSEGKVIRSDIMEFNSKLGLASALPKIEVICRNWLQDIPAEAVGIAFPSFVDVKQKKILGHNGKFPDYAKTDLESWAKERLGLPMVIENDANAAALGEGTFGCAAGSENYILMILGTGIGTAAVMNHQLIRGKHYQAGDLLGHIPLKVHGRKCEACPGSGCAEAQASTWALPHMVKESDLESPMKKEMVIDFRVLKKYYDAGDALAIAVFEECCEYWTNCLLAMVYAYDPEVIVLSGGVMKWGKELMTKLEQNVRMGNALPWKELRFCTAENPEHSVLLGLHALCLER